MQRGSALPILLLVIVILGGVLGFHFYKNFSKSLPVVSPLNNSNNPVKENKNSLFTNTELGFEFEYQKGFSVLEDTEEEFNQRAAGSASKSVNGDFRKNFKGYIGYEPAKFLGAAVLLDETKSFDKNPLTIWVFENPDNLSIEKWYEKYWYYPFVWGDYTVRRNSVAPTQDATISGQLAKSGVVNYQPGEPKFIYLSHNGKMYLFRIIGESANKILENFKFL